MKVEPRSPRAASQLVAELGELSNLASELVEPYGRSVAASSRTWAAATHFIVVARYVNAASHYSVAFPNAQHIPTEPLTTLVRGLWEACDALHYAYLEKTSEAEAELRRIVGALHHDHEEGDFRRLLGLQRGDVMSNDGLRARFFAEQQLENNMVFNALSEAEQLQIRGGHRARRKLPGPPSLFGWTRDETAAVFKFLSNFAHSTTWSAYGAAIRATDQRGTTSALLVANHIGAWTIEHYRRRRSKLATRLTVAQRRLLTALNQRETLGELRQVWEPESVHPSPPGAR